MYQWNRWSCFANSLQQKNCTKDGVHASAYEREKYKLSASADDWNCKCLFGEYWKDMTNVHFAPQPTIKPPTTTANVTVINAGSIGQDVGMMGFIIVLPLFRAILEQLNYN
ncbi:hypothetical protein niasHT_038893 [Heterodera trifolii]|uniref:Uncharacterized protein n=1 Tax=Heterodera trifolii TaxID=157864 RepID=A0ABD2ISK5_9BILA